MKSRWSELKPAVLALRQNGKSLAFISKNLEIPRSTLSGWCKEVALSASQQQQLADNKLQGLAKARRAAAQHHHLQKQARLREAKLAATQTLALLPFTPVVVELALAFLYWGKGKNRPVTAIGSADPRILQFFLGAIEMLYDVRMTDVICELHLRTDQNADHEMDYWSQQLAVPKENFKRTYFDRRAQGSLKDNYHGVCRVYGPSIAIQRKLVYLYKSFFEKLRENLGD